MERRKKESETRMLERRISNNRADLTGDQRMNYFIAWFTQWSELQRADFIPVLVANMSGNPPSEGFSSMQINGGASKKPPSLFDCQLKLFNDWFSGWSDDQKNYIVLRLQDIDRDFYRRYESFESKGPETATEKDYFEPGVPPELVRKSSRSVLGPYALEQEQNGNVDAKCVSPVLSSQQLAAIAE